MVLLWLQRVLVSNPTRPVHAGVACGRLGAHANAGLPRNTNLPPRLPFASFGCQGLKEAGAWGCCQPWRDGCLALSTFELVYCFSRRKVCCPSVLQACRPMACFGLGKAVARVHVGIITSYTHVVDVPVFEVGWVGRNTNPLSHLACVLYIYIYVLFSWSSVLGVRSGCSLV